MNPPQDSPPPPAAPTRDHLVGWVMFWILHGLTWLIALMSASPDFGFSLLFFIPLASIYGGIWIAVRYYKVAMARVGLGILFIIMLLIVNTAICFAGCMAGSAWR